MSDHVPIKRALISVYDKTGLADLGQALASHGVEIVSTGATARALRAAGVEVTDVSELTGFPECLDGRVKTLHPGIHAGLLADLRIQYHRDQLAQMGLVPFQLLVSNLYPFAQTVASGASPDEIIEQIDIGGPAMVRAAAKNHANVAVVTAPRQYPQLLTALAEGGYSFAERRALAAQAFAHTSAYDTAVASWFAGQANSPVEELPVEYAANFTMVKKLRYGENSHQTAGLYLGDQPFGLAAALQLHGKEMSYNNYVDADAAYRAAYDFEAPACAIIKHANPCGIAVADFIVEAHRKAFECDPVSAYGGVVAVNCPVDLALAEQIAPIFTEVVVAPGYEEDAFTVLTAKKNLRLLLAEPYEPLLQIRQISGGMLAQQPDLLDEPGDSPDDWQLVSGPAADAETLADLAFAWKACRSVKSNAILLAKGQASVGIGMGQVNRVDSCRLAIARAGERAAGSVAASDAFFPFPDGAEVLIDGGVKAIVQPGGSIRDDETIAVANAAGVTMYLTGVRHFNH
ncbi:MAG: bifunctional phosphoribosylaminoimidazolecarboxamide formyltransferase/IMP cyclohydrolase [Propionibacteriaceae bacterium]|nr:bifunctional phosphoribosylaminoimidazolecarboxamide formyltransferase/IMP cyclohydrolase [Propionibacteriaceae bacterium]